MRVLSAETSEGALRATWLSRHNHVLSSTAFELSSSTSTDPHAVSPYKPRLVKGREVLGLQQEELPLWSQ